MVKKLKPRWSVAASITCSRCWIQAHHASPTCWSSSLSEKEELHQLSYAKHRRPDWARPTQVQRLKNEDDVPLYWNVQGQGNRGLRLLVNSVTWLSLLFFSFLLLFSTLPLFQSQSLNEGLRNWASTACRSFLLGLCVSNMALFRLLFVILVIKWQHN